MTGATITIPVLKGASNWDRWYQIVYEVCQTAGIHPILTGQITRPKDENDQWETANAWTEGNIRMSLESGDYARIAGHIHGKTCYFKRPDHGSA